MSELEVFRYADQQVRTFEIDGEPWFVLADICAVLDIANPRNVAARLDEDEKGVRPLDTPGGVQSVTIVNESGMYQVVLRSDKPEAKQFRWWVTHEVLPSIRRTGSYVVETPEQLMSRALLTAQGIIAAKDQQIATLAPSAEAWDELASADGDYSVADAAKILARAGVKTGPQRLFEQLAGIHWVHRAHDGKWRAYANAVDNGYLTEKPQSHHHPRTGELVLDAPQVRVTVRGLERLRVRLGAIEVAA
ncbi:BRO family protein [Microbacterium sp. NPDC057944]|uniref:BRO family protein n=1 Tax=Microbacterium sp. NPDC057944 TaxID=3346286 RepID=UPI0036D786D9